MQGVDFWGEDDGEGGAGGVLVESAYRGDVEGEGWAVVMMCLYNSRLIDTGVYTWGYLYAVCKVLHMSMIRLCS